MLYVSAYVLTSGKRVVNIVWQQNMQFFSSVATENLCKHNNKHCSWHYKFLVFISLANFSAEPRNVEYLLLFFLSYNQDFLIGKVIII